MADSLGASMPPLSPPALNTPSPPVQDAELSYLALLAALLILAAALVVGRVIQRKKITWLGEAGAGLLLGLLIGLVMHVAGVSAGISDRLSFKASVFLLVFMPTIMFHAGFTLDAAAFLHNIGSICMTAFLGTTISTFVIGVMMWGFGQWGWCYKMSLLYNLTFGALISATDPVAVLAVFESLNANKDLFINVFGESVLNDAVAMVLYNTVSRFLDAPVTTGGVFKGIGIFVGIFVASVLIGLVVGFLAALAFKTGFFHAASQYDGMLAATPVPEPAAQQLVPDKVKDNASLDAPLDEDLQRISPFNGPQATCKSTSLAEHGQDAAVLPLVAPPPPVDELAACYETTLALVLAYVSYMAANAAYLSGITAIISTGMMMNAYMRPNISEAADMRVSIVSKTLAIAFELFSFVYIGLSVLQAQDWTIVRYVALCLVALAVSRLCNIYPLCALVNYLRPPERRISHKAQFMMWWSGLRGPMAFALALDASEKYGLNGTVMKTCTLYLILITVLVNGGLSAYLLRRLRLRAQDTPDVQGAAKTAAAAGGSTDAGEHARLLDQLHSSEAWALLHGTPGGSGSSLNQTAALRQLQSIAEDGHGLPGTLQPPGLVPAGPEPSLCPESAEPSLAHLRGHSLGRLEGINSEPHAACRASSLQDPGSPSTAAARPGGPFKLLESIRDLNSGKLVVRLQEVDKHLSKLLVSSRLGSPGSSQPVSARGRVDAGDLERQLMASSLGGGSLRGTGVLVQADAGVARASRPAVGAREARNGEGNTGSADHPS